MKLYKKLILIFLISLSCIFLCSCSSKDDLKDNFISYYNEQLNNHVFTTSLNTEMIIVDIKKENISQNPKVVLTLGLGNSDIAEKTYQWLQLSPDKRKADLKESGDMVVKYAQDNNWSTDYYLYVDVCQVYDGCSIVYDYEQDKIWIPNCENSFLEMYQKFGTFYKKELEENEEGVKFLVENNLAYIKHKEVEYSNNMSYTVFIQDGEFKSYGEDESTKY